MAEVAGMVLWGLATFLCVASSALIIGGWVHYELFVDEGLDEIIAGALDDADGP